MNLPASVPRRSPVRPQRRTGARLTLLFMSTVIALGIAEVVLRVKNPLGFRNRGTTLVLPANTVYDIQADERSRSSQLEAHVVHTKNSLGFRGPEPPADLASALAIIAVGGSTTECFYLGDGRTWPEQMGAKLAPGLRELWVNNAGLDGHSSFGHLLLTQQVLASLRPDVAVYLVGINEMFTDAPREYDRVDWSLAGALADRSEVAATVLNLLRWRQTRKLEDLGTMPKPIALRDRPHQPMEPAVAERLIADQAPRLDAYRGRLERLVRDAREAGIEPVLVTQPMLLGAVDPTTGVDTRTIGIELWEEMDGATAWRLLELYNDVTRETGDGLGVLVVDVARTLPKDSVYFYDFVHFTNEGAEAVGGIVADALRPWLAARFPTYVGGGG